MFSNSSDQMLAYLAEIYLQMILATVEQFFKKPGVSHVINPPNMDNDET